MCDNSSIASAASNVLMNAEREYFSGVEFTREQIDAISNAIAAAIDEYDRQNQSSEK